MREYPTVIVDTSIGRFMVLFNGLDTLQVRAGGAYDQDMSPIEIRGNKYRVSNQYILKDDIWELTFKWHSNERDFSHNNLPKTYDAKILGACQEAIRLALEAMPDGPKLAHIKVLEDSLGSARADFRKALEAAENEQDKIDSIVKQLNEYGIVQKF